MHGSSSKNRGFPPFFYMVIVSGFIILFPESAPELLKGKPMVYLLTFLLSGSALTIFLKRTVPDKTFQTLLLAYFLYVLKDSFLSGEILLGAVFLIPGIALVWNAERVISTFSELIESIDEKDFEGKVLKKLFIPLLFSAVLYQFLLPFGPAGQLRKGILLSEEQFVAEKESSNEGDLKSSELLQLEKIVKEMKKDYEKLQKTMRESPAF